MAAYEQPLRPVALPGQVVQLQPNEGLRRVRDVEPLAEVGPIDFGSISSGSTATDEDGNERIEVSELEMRQNQLAQYRYIPTSNVETQLRQTGRAEPRMQNADQTTVWTRDTPGQLREFFVLEDGVPYLQIENPNLYDLDRSLVKFHGYKFHLEPDAVSEADADEPIAVPVDKLERTTQQPGQSSGGQRNTRTSNRRRR